MVYVHICETSVGAKEESRDVQMNGLFLKNGL